MYFITFIFPYFSIILSFYLFVQVIYFELQSKRKMLSKCIMNCLLLAMEISMKKKSLNLETLGVPTRAIMAMDIFI
jgi:hypothetical protein